MSLDKEGLEQVKKIFGASNMSAIKIPMKPDVRDEDLINPIDTLHDDFMDTINGIKAIKKMLGEEPPEEFYKSVIFFQRIALGCVLEVYNKLSEPYKKQ